MRHARGGGLASAVVEYGSFLARAAWHAARIGHVDVVHIHNPPDFLVLAGVIPRLRAARMVLDIHDFAPDMFEMRFGTSRPARFLLRMLERLAAAFADAVVTVHEPYRRALIAKGVRSEKITVVMNTVDESLLPARPLRGDGYRVVYHGSITPHYGVSLLVEAAAVARLRVPELTLDLVGEGDALPAVVRQAKRLGLDDALSVTGTYVPRREALAAAAGASVGVVPNLPIPLNRYALPSKLFEYVALGVPAVAPDLATIREHFDGDEVLFFRAGDPQDLARAIVEVARNPDAAAARAERAKQRFEGYRWQASASRYVVLLDRLAAR